MSLHQRKTWKSFNCLALSSGAHDRHPIHAVVSLKCWMVLFLLTEPQMQLGPALESRFNKLTVKLSLHYIHFMICMLIRFATCCLLVLTLCQAFTVHGGILHVLLAVCALKKNLVFVLSESSSQCCFICCCDVIYSSRKHEYCCLELVCWLSETVFFSSLHVSFTAATFA